MKADDKRAAKAAYRERKAVAGIFAVRCSASGEKWVGEAADLEKVQNRIWFSLGTGRDPRPGLQRAWTTHGADSFTFEVLERLKVEELPYVRDALLRERLAHWRNEINAAAI